MRGVVGSLLAVALTVNGVRGGDLAPDLSAALDAAQPGEIHSTLVYLDQADIAAIENHLYRIMAGRELRHRVVVEALHAQAAATQGPVLARLQEAAATGRVAFYEPYWIGNVIRVDAVADEIRAVAAHPDVVYVFLNYAIDLIEPVEEVEAPGAASAPEPGIQLIQADRVWSELGITGEGVLAAVIDTGVDGDHPAMESRWRGLDVRYRNNPEWAWYDPYNSRNDFPYDCCGHGSHTMGTTIGGAPGDQVGVAPGAQWIAAGAIDRGGGIERTVADAIKAFQWMADPDDNPRSVFDVPHTCGNSWGLINAHGYSECHQIFWTWIDAAEAAGTTHIFAAGNSGLSEFARPADRASTAYDSIAIGACDANEPGCPIAGFSSRGPTNCSPGGRPATKPEVTAPGVSVRSCWSNGGYIHSSGTSMATPHVNGVMALLYSANPDLTSDEAKQILYDTATDKGPRGEDNTFGWGLVNAYDAVYTALGSVAFACCFDDGNCEDLVRDDCLSQGGEQRYGETCDTFRCPAPGACCIDNFTCEFILERDCFIRRGDFLGEGVGCEQSCPCDVVKKLKGKCKGKNGGTVKGILKFYNNSWNGRTVRMGVGPQVQFDVPVKGKKAVLITCCFSGPQELKLLEPAGCLDPVNVNCPD